jgi:hypothetical protein
MSAGLAGSQARGGAGSRRTDGRLFAACALPAPRAAAWSAGGRSKIMGGGRRAAAARAACGFNSCLPAWPARRRAAVADRMVCWVRLALVGDAAGDRAAACLEPRRQIEDYERRPASRCGACGVRVLSMSAGLASPLARGSRRPDGRLCAACAFGGCRRRPSNSLLGAPAADRKDRLRLASRCGAGGLPLVPRLQARPAHRRAVAPRSRRPDGRLCGLPFWGMPLTEQLLGAPVESRRLRAEVGEPLRRERLAASIHDCRPGQPAVEPAQQPTGWMVGWVRLARNAAGARAAAWSADSLDR